MVDAYAYDNDSYLKPSPVPTNRQLAVMYVGVRYAWALHLGINPVTSIELACEAASNYSIRVKHYLGSLSGRSLARKRFFRDVSNYSQSILDGGQIGN